MIAVAERNANPLNIRVGRDRWQGAAERHEMTEAQREDGRFVVFRSPEWGVRAAARVLQTYRTRYGIATIRGIIERWAPEKDRNDTAAYIKHVSDITSWALDERLDTADSAVLASLIDAMHIHEAGYSWLTAKQIETGIAMLDLPAPTPKPYRVSKRAIGTAVTVGVPGAITILGKAKEVIGAAKDAVGAIAPDLARSGDGWAVALILGVGLTAFVCFTIWTLIVDRGKERVEEG